MRLAAAAPIVAPAAIASATQKPDDWYTGYDVAEIHVDPAVGETTVVHFWQRTSDVTWLLETIVDGKTVSCHETSLLPFTVLRPVESVPCEIEWGVA